LTVKKQKIGKKLVDARSKSIGTFKTWNVNPKGDRSAAVPHLAAFAERYGGSVATIYCTDLNRGGVSQGTGFSVSANLSEDAKARAGGSTYLITAGHVVDDCFFEQHRNVSVLYRGQTYPGFVVSAFSDPDLGSVITSAPIPYAKLADTTSKKPGVGDIGVSVSSAGGVPGTVTQGQISGVSQKQLNSGIPAGQGSSGGPVFNNVGEVIGIVVARNVSLTELVAIPSFCGTVFLKEVCSITW
jgi:S1-C subfamily serine protease